MIDLNTLNNAQATPVRTNKTPSTTKEKILGTIAAVILGALFVGVAIQLASQPRFPSNRPLQSEIQLQRALDAAAAQDEFYRHYSNGSRH